MKSELFSSVLMYQLEKLGRMFVWRRKSLRDSVVDGIKNANDQHEIVVADRQSLRMDFDALTEKHGQLNERHANTMLELSNTKQSLGVVQRDLQREREQYLLSQEVERRRFDELFVRHLELGNNFQSLQVDFAALTERYDQLNEEHENTLLDLSGTRQSLEYTQRELDREREQYLQQQEIDRGRIDELFKENMKLDGEFQSLHKRHGDTWTRFELVSQLLAAHAADNIGLSRFRDLLANDYMRFAESESSLAAEASALMMLQSIEQELSLLVSFRDIRERTIVGIVGGFSSGKSEFVNSFIRDPNVRLAVGIQPVTVIPSYVLASDEREIRGYSINGGYIDIDVNLYKNISHAFINSFSFDLKSLMPFMCVGIEMDPEYFNNICFIDTPGYNPPATAAEHSQGDKRTAIQFAQQSDAIIWLIGLDVNGTVPDSDIDFIQQIGLEKRAVYVVLTKADLKAEDDIEYIMDEVQDILHGESIPIVGISAYSSTQRNEIAYRDVRLLDFFTQINKRGDAQKHLLDRLRRVFDMYDDAILSDLNNLRSQKTAINGLRLDSLEIGGEEVYERLLGAIDKLEQELDSTLLEGWLKESKELFGKFSDAIRLTEVLDQT